MTPVGWKEASAGFDGNELAKILIDRGLMISGKDGHRSKVFRVPDHGSQRLYYIHPKILEGEDV
jgi:hypothetical protein